jgi:FAD/FMN-containing dehydrogenase
MNQNSLYKKLATICGKNNITNDQTTLYQYSKDMSFFPEKLPKYVIWPSNVNQIEKILKLANMENFHIIPISSGGPRHHGDTIPHNDNCIILDLSKMKKIINIDRKNRVVMIEPGVTFEELIPKLRKQNLRLLLPLHPRNTKSVVTSALEREPIIIPRYHWDTSDPLLCTEVVFGTGDLFRTGTAAGPGTIKEQKKSGQAQVNPMGPTQFNPFRIIQGAQGSMGIVSWATIKLELNPSIQKVFHLQSENIQELLDFQYELIKYRLCDEVFILNNLNLACLIKQDAQEIVNLAKELDKWNLIYVVAGHGTLADDKINYLTDDINDLKEKLNLNKVKNNQIIEEKEILKVINEQTPFPWKVRLKGGYQDIFFLTNFEQIPKFISIVESRVPENLGVYIQPINQGTSYHCEFDFYYDLNNREASELLKKEFLDISIELMNSGAFFNRPYSLWAKEVYKQHDKGTEIALKKVKAIFDPNNILNPGVLCFED